jgi:Ni,Fe-hydrogenase III component G
MNIEDLNNALKSKLNYYELKEDQDSYGNLIAWIKLKEKKDIEIVAKTIKAYHGRCIVATCFKNDDDTHSVIYHFDIDGLLVNAQVDTDDKTIHSITSILPSANWAEREIREMYGVEPVGHPCKDRLFLDYSIAKGVLNEYIPFSKISVGISQSDVLWEQVHKGEE